MCLRDRPEPGPPGPPMQVIYPVPVYTGIVVLNPPEHPDYSRRNPNSQGPKKAPAPAAAAPVPLSPPAAGMPPPATSRTTPLPPAGRPGSASKPGPTLPPDDDHGDNAADSAQRATAGEPAGAAADGASARTAVARAHSSRPRDAEGAPARTQAGKQT